MLDQFFHNLIDANTKADDHKIGFLDCLLLVCATLFSELIRLQLRNFSLEGYLGETVLDTTMHTNTIVRVSENAALFFVAVLMFIVVFLSQKSSRKAALAYTITLFLPSSIAMGGMNGYLDSVLAGLFFLSALLFYWKKYILAGIGFVFAILINSLKLTYFVGGCKSFSIYEIFGFGPFSVEYVKAGTAFVLFLTGMMFFVRGKEILAGKRASVLYFLFLVCTMQLLLPKVWFSVCFAAELLAVFDAMICPRKIYRAILLAGVNFAIVYQQMLDTTFIPAYLYSYILLGLLFDLAWELYQLRFDLAQKETILKTRWAIVLFVIFATLIGAYVRIVFRHFESGDYRFCFKPWTDAFKLGGGFKAIAGDFYNYPPFYMYMMYLVSLLKMEPLYPLKAVSILWDFFLALGAALTVGEVTKSQKKAALTYAMIWCLPTVVANSALWAQCDVMYVCLTIWSLYFYAKDKPKLSMLFYAGAFSFKMQVFFVLPVYVYLWVHKKYKLYQFLYLPGLYALSCIPAWLIGGKSLKDLLLLYVGQSQQEPWMLSWYWPNIYQIFGVHEFYEFLAKAGMYGAIAVTMILLYDMARRLKNTDAKLITLMMFTYSVVIPFFLPYMHERYGYLADVLAVMLFVIMPRFMSVAVLEILISYVAYACHLHEQMIVPTWVYCIPMACIVWYVLLSVYRSGEASRT